MSDRRSVRDTLGFVVALLMVFVCTGCASSPTISELPTGSSSESGITFDRTDLEEIRVGNEIHKSIIEQCAPFPDLGVHAYVASIGLNLTQYAERKNLPYQFTVLYDDRIYATSAPGGFVYITTGFIHFLENEAELAAVLAHEIARVQYRDPRATDAKKIFDTLSQGSMMIGPFFGTYGTVAVLGIQAIQSAFFTEISDEERTEQSDNRALNYLVSAMYDPQGYLDVLYKMIYSSSDERKILFHYLFSHPITFPRIERITAYFNTLPLEGRTFTVDRERFFTATTAIRRHYEEP